MSVSPLAGKKAPIDLLIDVNRLEEAYYRIKPDPEDPTQLVSFGTSGHRGSSLNGTFNELHVLAITQAICEFRRNNGIDGPLYIGMDTHGLSKTAQQTAIEVLAANGVETIVHGGGEVTPTPVISHAIVSYNAGRKTGLADGIVVTPSHNPPEDGGIKYNPPNGGPADTDVTGWIQDRANAILRGGGEEVKHLPFRQAIATSYIHQRDLITPYVDDLENVVNLEAVRSAGISIGVDPLGGSSVHFWQPIAEHYGLNLTVVNPVVDPTFSFMTVDHDGKIRMDCSSPYAMAGLVHLRDRFRIAFGNDPDADRHGIVTPGAGLLNPNHYLAVAIDYLLKTRTAWSPAAAVGKTLVSSSMIDRVVGSLGRNLMEVPVGFKWFAPGLLDGTICFGGEESAGASFLRQNGRAWTTDKDGIIMNLLAAEITAVTGRDPGEHFESLVARFGRPYYKRIDAPATPEQKEKLKRLDPSAVKAGELAGEPIEAALTRAPGNGAPIGGLKIVARSGWFAARPSGTENIYKIYAESFKSEEHLELIIVEAQQIVANALRA
jgi:phosphoglucomutase